MAWTKPPNWHVTLFFLGATPEWQVGMLQQQIDSTFHEIHSFTSPLRGLGVFPKKGKPRVLWLGLENFQPLMAAYVALGDLLQKNGFLVDPKPLKPHLTLARIKSLADRPSLESLLNEYQSFDFGTVTINRVTLFESISTASGMKYVPLFEKWLHPDGLHQRIC
jgi:2'-5' RNA ligase